jgi:hypothetical protein
LSAPIPEHLASYRGTTGPPPDGREPEKMDISIGGQMPDADLIRRYRDAGVSRVSVSLPSEKADTILPVLDLWVKVMRVVNGA